MSFLLLSFASFEVLAQERSITGKVTSAEDGSGLPGVNVILKGTTTGTVTDIDGNYKLTVPSDGGTLIYSFIGLVSQEVEMGSRSVIDIQMVSDITQLSEVVVTAQGLERESKSLGYSVETVSSDKVQGVAEPDPLRALSGKVPGVNINANSGAPGSSTKITIRGNSSLLNDNQPLFVVDGVPYNNDFITSSGVNPGTGGLTGGGAFSSRMADLDPNNIESISVLKGGAAAALYGSRAANGVVLITTKTGSVKDYNKGFEVTYNFSYSVEKIGNLPNYQNTYGVGTKFNYAQANGSWGAPFPGTKPYANLDSIPHWYNGTPGFEELWGTNVPYRAYPDNVEDVFQTGSLMENSVTISGGTENSRLTATLSSLDQEGFVPNSEFKRHNISIGGSTNLENGLYVSGNIAVTKSIQKGPISGIGNLGQNNTSFFARAMLLGRNWDMSQPYQNPLDLGSAFMVGRSNANNPLWSAENTGISSEVDRYAATFSVGYDILDWLSVNARLGLNTYNQLTQEFQRPNGTGTPIGTFTERNDRFTEINGDFILTGSRDINEDLNIKVVAGVNINQRTQQGQQVNGSGYVTFDIEDLDNMSAISPAGGFYSRKRILGAYADVNLGFRDFLFLGLTGRNDWSSTLPIDGNSFFYPAANASFVLSDVVDLPSFMNFVKVRGGWSQVGNDTDPYLLSTVFLANSSLADQISQNTAQKPFRAVSGATLSNVATDPGLKPEQTTEIEAGLDLTLFDRITLNATWYKRNTTDQIGQIALADETGFRSFLTNFGEVENKGWEIGLDITPIQLDNGFRWNFFGTFTHNKNLIVELRDGVDQINFGSGFAGSVGNVHIAGQEFGLLEGSVDARDDEGNLLIDPASGELIESAELGIIGNPNPDFKVGFTNTFSFKGITLGAVIDWTQGGDVFSTQIDSYLGRGVLEFQGNDRERYNIIDGVYGNINTQEPLRDENGDKIQNRTIIDTNTLYFGQTFASNGSDEWVVFDGTVVRLREVSLTYALPQSLLENTFIGRVNIGLVGRNLWYNAPNFTEDSNYDPEASQFGNRNQSGIHYGVAPSAKRYGVKLTVTF